MPSVQRCPLLRGSTLLYCDMHNYALWVTAIIIIDGLGQIALSASYLSLNMTVLRK